ncbi:TadE/TadG family type IV pilus assembly protein [Novosphingobium bradum]|uniref:TadE/TadG family type IV pilus assembly protein n=1 Tax=Novosphingobium bradum TaxID=1737444 RepID=A0ABV7IN02_9SPHN
MTPRGLRSVVRHAQGAAAPMFALSLAALVVVAGVGFDYGRLATTQSELQNAADQAALAAATQLDGEADAMARAEAAARSAFATAASAYVNETRVANDSQGRPITTLQFAFYQDYANDAPSGELDPAGDGRNAHVVRVTVAGRQVFYALTPIVAVLTSGDIAAHAMARLDRAVCQMPTAMVCVDRSDFQLPTSEGKGLVMRSLSSSGVDPLAPGNLGFLDIGSSQSSMGENVADPSCRLAENVQTLPGFRTNQSSAFDTRFDIYPNNTKPDCTPGTGDFCPAQGTRKNYVLAETTTVTTSSATPPPPPACGTYDSRANAWVPNAGVVNFPEDKCFSTGACTYLGDGDWDIDGYLAANHPGVLASQFAKGTRYEVYKWELADPATRLAPRLVSSSVTTRKQGANYRHTFVNQCAYAEPVFGAPVTPSQTQKDRRVMTVAVVDCEGLHGRDDVTIKAIMDVFLLSPSIVTGSGSTTKGQFNVEVIGPALRAGDLNGFQFYGRNKAVLIR